jgi:hypothetical protein
MGRGTARQVIGALCGIGLVVGVVVLLRSVHWPAVVHWLRSPTGLYVQSGAALVLQFSGGVLVVRDVVRAEKNLAWLDYWFAELEQVTDTDMQARRAAEGDELFYSRCSRPSSGSASSRGRQASWLVTSPGCKVVAPG